MSTASSPDARPPSRVEIAWRARVLGATWEEAAQVAKYANRSNAYNAVTKVYGKAPEPDRQALRALWRERLDWLWKSNVRDVADGKPGSVVAGVRLAGEAARLDGLAEPSRLEVGVSPTVEEIENWVDRIVGPRAEIEEGDIFDVEVVEED